MASVCPIFCRAVTPHRPWHFHNNNRLLRCQLTCIQMRMRQQYTHLWVGPEGANLNLASGDCPVGVHHNGQERVLVLLLGHLRANVDARQPASIAWVAVVPPYHVFQPAHDLEKHEALCRLWYTSMGSCLSPSCRGNPKLGKARW